MIAPKAVKSMLFLSLAPDNGDVRAAHLFQAQVRKLIGCPSLADRSRLAVCLWKLLQPRRHNFLAHLAGRKGQKSQISRIWVRIIIVT